MEGEYLAVAKATEDRPSSVDVFIEHREQFRFGDALLFHRVAFAEGEGVAFLFDRVEVDGHAPRGADLVLTTAAPPSKFRDRARSGHCGRHRWGGKRRTRRGLGDRGWRWLWRRD